MTRKRWRRERRFTLEYLISYLSVRGILGENANDRKGRRKKKFARRAVIDVYA